MLVRIFIQHTDYEVGIIYKFGFANHCHVVRASAKTVRYISLVGKVGLEDVCRVGPDAMEEVIVGWVEQFRNGRHVTAGVAKPFTATQERIEPHAVGSQTHPGPGWRRVLDAQNDYRSEYIM